MLRLAHLSDPHLHFAALPSPLAGLWSKRSLSRWSWARGRGALQQPAVLAAAVEDVCNYAPDHWLISGDITNFSLPGEFQAAARWLETLAPVESVSVVPGNHDALVPVPWPDGLGQWQPWFGPAVPTFAEQSREHLAKHLPFPYVRQFGAVALIGLSSALPTPPGFASGALGDDQIATLELLLNDLARQGLVRVVALHHPPADRVVPLRKALRDRSALRAVLARAGAELVLHGHSRDARFDPLPGPHGLIPVLGVPSISAIPNPKDEGARWNLIEIDANASRATITVTARVLDESRTAFRTAGRYQLC